MSEIQMKLAWLLILVNDTNLYTNNRLLEASGSLSYKQMKNGSF